MKKSMFFVALVAVLVFAFVTTASATRARTWNYNTDYYSWGSTSGEGAIGTGTVLSAIGENPLYPGVHAGYTANTAKCGICHSVHRAKVGGVKLLNATVATCAGCHRAGTGTVTTKLVSWESGGPHSSGTNASCNTRGCHANSPHGVGTSTYAIARSVLLTSAVDAGLATASASATSGVTAALLAGTSGTAGQQSAVRTGYTCNISGCHDQTMLAVLTAGYSEPRKTVYTDPAVAPSINKTGHLSSVAMDSVSSFASVSDCESCHDQTDGGTTNGYTFPHSQTPFVAGNSGSTRSWLWMTIADRQGGLVQGMTGTEYQDKAKDGACLKCHRNNAGDAGVGISY